MDPKRDHYGRYILTDPTTGEEKHWTRATTFAESLEDQFGLTKWKQRAVLVGAASRQDMVALAQSLDLEEDKKDLDDLCRRAMTIAKTDTRSNLGTALHKLTERYDKGLCAKKVGPVQQADLDAYIALKETQGVQTRGKYVERITVIPEFGVAGTMDRIVRWKDQLYIADLKTVKDVERGIGKIALQLALYAHGTGLWNEVHATWEAMPAVDQETALVIHVPAGEATASLWTVDITRGWRACQLAAEVREWRRAKDLTAKVN